MSTISTALRNFKEPTKEQLTHIFFSLSPNDAAVKTSEHNVDKMEINAVLSFGVQGVEDSYVSHPFMNNSSGD